MIYRTLEHEESTGSPEDSPARGESVGAAGMPEASPA